jgi:ribosomal protein S18 acetylase RimI-like enzyme
MTAITIRKAKPEDSPKVASLISLAMLDIVFGFIGVKSTEKAMDFMTALVSVKGNQYSYENCWVVETENEIIAAACLYDGAKLQKLRKPVMAKIKEMFGRDFQAEDETQAGEYYIDSVGVDPRHQGTGIGTQLLQFLINEYVYKRKHTLGLLVDYDNPSAKRLYAKLGFKLARKKPLIGKPMEHYQLKPA